MHEVSEEQALYIEEFLIAGETISEIAAQTGLPEFTVFRIATNNGTRPLPLVERSIPREQLEALRSAVADRDLVIENMILKLRELGGLD